MKSKLLLGLALVLSGGLFGCASHQTSPTAAKPNKFLIVSPWTNSPYTLVVSGSSNTPAAERTARQIIGKRVCLAPVETNGLPVFDGDPYRFYLVAITNPITRKICFTEPRDIYLATEKDLIGSTLPKTGFMTCIRSYSEVPARMGLEAAIVEFENNFDARAIYRWQQSNFSINLKIAAPTRFFIGSNAYATPTKVKAIDYTDGTLRFDIKGNLKMNGTFWVDLAARKTVKSVIDGLEMDLNNTNRFAVPIQNTH